MERELIKIIKLLNKHRIKYLLIGGFAAVLYGVPRSTFDIDIAVSLDSESISKTTSLLSDLGFVEKEKLEGGVRLTDTRVEIDLMFIERYKFNFFYEYRRKFPYKGTVIKMPNIMDLIRMKESSPREKDQQDAQYLRFILSSKTVRDV
ncbi:MAG: hypothetical protein KKD69_01690 [Euryarchaeota archaeon]|nr:hypothetical protein [Euryarchaeota archaeon]MCG2727624.1 hypothetical protein [Candidatus Methanoperedenaceae archaeon]